MGTPIAFNDDPHPSNTMQNRRLVPMRTEIVERTRAAVAGRIKRVCEHLPEQEFESLVARIADIEIRYALRREDAFFDTSGDTR